MKPNHPDKFYTLSSAGSGLFKDRGSKFISYAYPVLSQLEAEELLKKIRSDHPKASHVCYAFSIGIKDKYIRSSDDGEPSGTAGKPILNCILSYELDNIFVAVVRYFGGKKLGTSGLIKAYKSSSLDALNNSTRKTAFLEDEFTVNTSYKVLSKLIHFFKVNNIQIKEKNLDENPVIRVSVRKSKSANMLSQLEKVFLLRKNLEKGILFINSK